MIKKIVVFSLLLFCVPCAKAMNTEAFKLYSLVSQREFLWEKHIEDRKIDRKIFFDKELHKKMCDEIEIMAKGMGIDPMICSFGTSLKLVNTLQHWSYNAEIKK